MYLLPYQTLILLFQIFNDLVHFGHSLDICWISEVILLFCDEFHSHFIYFVLFFKSFVIGSEIVLYWRVKLSPSENHIHFGLEVSQILFLSVKLFIIAKLPRFLAEDLMLDFGLSGVGSAGVTGSNFLETSSSKDILDLIGVLVSSC